MSKFLETPDDKEKRKAILRKAEFEVNLAERELKEWKVYRRDSPGVSDISYRTNVTENTCKTPTRRTDSEGITTSPNLTIIEKRLKDLEEVRQIENEKHRQEIDRLESMIDKLQDSRKFEPKFEVLQRAYTEKNNEVERKNREISELQSRLKYLEKKRQSGRSLNRENSYTGKPVKPALKEEGYWREKAYELSTKYFITLRTMREELDNLKKTCTTELKDLKSLYMAALKLCKK